MKIRNVLITKVALLVFCLIALIFTQSCMAIHYYGVELRNASPRLTKETKVKYSKIGSINKGDLDPGLTPHGTLGGKSEHGELGPTPDEAIVSWEEKNGKHYEVKVKVFEVVKTRKPDGIIVFTIQPDRSVKVSYEPTDPRLKAFDKWQRSHGNP
jgi:hypothetical protein